MSHQHRDTCPDKTTIVIAAYNEEKVIGPFPRNIYGDTLSLTSDSTGISIAPVALR